VGAGRRALQHDAAEGEWEDPRSGWAEDRLRRFVRRLQGGVNAAWRVRVALAQGVGSMSQVLEGLMAGRERHGATRGVVHYCGE
jgi:hypothetical protein